MMVLRRDAIDNNPDITIQGPPNAKLNGSYVNLRAAHAEFLSSTGTPAVLSTLRLRVMAIPVQSAQSAAAPVRLEGQ